MTTISIHDLEYKDDVQGIKKIQFFPVGHKTYSAQNPQTINGIFISNIVSAPILFKKWNSFSLFGENLENVHVYIRGSFSDITKEKWHGPFTKNQDISSINGNKIQFSIIISEINCKIDKIDVSFESNQASVDFFSKTFNLGFSPKHILLTANATKNESSIMEFYISTKDSVDEKDYQLINVNKITEINNPFLQEKAKIMVKMYGDTTTPIKLHEISVALSGSGTNFLNIDFSSSSASYSSSSSTSIDSSSSNSGSSRSSYSSQTSSSIDSSSSSSEGFSSSSSSLYSSSSLSTSHSSLTSSSSISSSMSSSNSSSSSA